MAYFPTAGLLFKYIFHDIFNLSIFYSIDDHNLFSKELSRIADEKDFDFDRIHDFYDDLKQKRKIELHSDTINYIFERIMLNLEIYKRAALYLNIAFIDVEAFKKIIFRLFLGTLIYETELLINREKSKDIFHFPEENLWYISYWDTHSDFPLKTFINWLNKFYDNTSIYNLAEKIEVAVHGGRGEDYVEGIKRNLFRWHKEGHKVQRNTLNQWFESDEMQKFILSFIIASGYQTCIAMIDEYKITSDLVINVINRVKSEKYSSYVSSSLNELRSLNKGTKIFNAINHKLFSLDTPKEGDDHVFGLTELSRIENEKKLPRFYIAWFKARYNVLLNSKKNREMALELYQQAFKSAKYSAGYDIVDIIKEYLTLACYLGKSKDVKIAYKWAYYYGLFKDQYIKNDTWFMDLQSKQYYQIFPPGNYYHKFPNKNKKSRGRKYSFITIFNDNEQIEINDPNEITQINDKKISILMKCCLFGKLDDVKRLLENGADPNYISEDGSSPLIISIQNKYFDISSLLLSYNLSYSINTKTKRKGISALSSAIDRSAVSLVESILKQGADPDLIISEDHETALYYTIGYINLIIKPGAELVKSRMSRSLMEQDVDALKKNNIFKQISSNVFDYEHKFHANDFLKNILDLHINDKERFLQLTGCNFNLESLLKIVELLLEYGANINHRHHNLNGFTPLTFAAEVGSLQLFDLLFKYNPDITILMSDGSSILHPVFDKANVELFNYIIENVSADLIHDIKNTTDSSGNTPLHFLLHGYSMGGIDTKNFFNILNKFMDYSPDIDIKSHKGISPIEMAIKLNNNYIVKLLSEKGSIKYSI